MSREHTIAFDLFGVLGRLAGATSLGVGVPPGTTVEQALAALAQLQPALAPELPRCACAIGDTVVPRTRPLAAGERLALLPPVSGG